MHRIRLGPPWTTSLGGAGTRHARKFGRPRTLDSGDRVWLVCDALPTPAKVAVNGQPLGTATESRFEADITELLNPRNEVVIETATDAALGDVALEIRGD